MHVRIATLCSCLKGSSVLTLVTATWLSIPLSDVFVLVCKGSFGLLFWSWWSWLTFQDPDSEALFQPYLEASDLAPALVWLWKVPCQLPSLWLHFPICGEVKTDQGHCARWGVERTLRRQCVLLIPSECILLNLRILYRIRFYTYF